MQPDLERGLPPAQAAALYVREAAFTHLNRLVGSKSDRGCAACSQKRSGLGPNMADVPCTTAITALLTRNNPPLRMTPCLPLCWPPAAKSPARSALCSIPIPNRLCCGRRDAAIQEAINLINALPVELWQEDEIIGWIYQFYNAEEKKAIRKRGKPSRPIEVAVINQFFTPRWVVKFLVDNTLGRLWLEMHPDSQRVRAKCDYLVPEPPSPDQPLS